ncbi:hypothetical protein MRB53_021399 [Persea americana]|uniref:Uncharacterized protein n=1 Tax=Persea americana TaxID=3435 RepID=A0ACC2L3L9_PERAE|nr:hypothetical protein MRB53_021399 [Persea americana]
MESRRVLVLVLLVVMAVGSSPSWGVEAAYVIVMKPCTQDKCTEDCKIALKEKFLRANCPKNSSNMEFCICWSTESGEE